MLQAFVIFTLNWTAVSWGFLQGQIACMVDALQKQDEGITLSEGEISVIGEPNKLYLCRYLFLFY